jgi:hypothetical protein
MVQLYRLDKLINSKSTSSLDRLLLSKFVKPRLINSFCGYVDFVHNLLDYVTQSS